MGAFDGSGFGYVTSFLPMEPGKTNIACFPHLLYLSAYLVGVSPNTDGTRKLKKIFLKTNSNTLLFKSNFSVVIIHFLTKVRLELEVIHINYTLTQ